MGQPMKPIKCAIMFSLLMLMIPLTGCVSDGANGQQGATGPEGPEGPPGADGSSLHLVDNQTGLPECNAILQGQIFFVQSDGAFQVCSLIGWTVVDLSGPSGLNGTNGTDGQDGIDGANGTDGQDGIDGVNGTDGISALAVTNPELEGSNCINGGIRIDVGMDTNRNGTLDSDEIEETSYLCNGSDGLNGVNGTSSQFTMLSEVTPTSSQLECNVGGLVIKQGYDNGDGLGIQQNGILEDDEVDYTTTLCSFHSVELISSPISNSNIQAAVNPPGLYTIGFLINIHSTLYFTANDGSTGYEIWAYDYNNKTTWLVADIAAGTASSAPGDYLSIQIGEHIFFDADDGINGRELWAVSNTNHTAWMVSDINPGSDSYPGRWIENEVIHDSSTLFFDANDGSTGYELWALNTENMSTWRVTDINTNTFHYSGSSYAGDYLMEIYEDTIYFSARDQNFGRELWAFNILNQSTWMVADIGANQLNGNPGADFSLLDGDLMFFDAIDGIHGVELWAHNTSNHTTWMVADVASGANYSYPGASMIYKYGSNLFFDANDQSGIGRELWAYNLSNNSHWLVADIWNGTGYGFPGSYMDAFIHDTMYFSANDGQAGNELWAYSLINSTVWLVADINPGNSYSKPGEVFSVVVGEYIVFSSTNSGVALWSYDTNSGGLIQITSSAGVKTDLCGLNTLNTIANGKLYFAGQRCSGGVHLYTYDLFEIEHEIYYS